MSKPSGILPPRVEVRSRRKAKQHFFTLGISPDLHLGSTLPIRKPGFLPTVTVQGDHPKNWEQIENKLGTNY